MLVQQVLDLLLVHFDLYLMTLLKLLHLSVLVTQLSLPVFKLLVDEQSAGTALKWTMDSMMVDRKSYAPFW